MKGFFFYEHSFPESNFIIKTKLAQFKCVHVHAKTRSLVTKKMTRMSAKGKKTATWYMYKCAFK